MPDSSSLESLFARLYLDHHVKTRLAVDLRGLGFDVLTCEEAGQRSASDEDQLAFATVHNRSIVTFNIRDFAPLHEQWQAAGRAHAGIIVSQQLGGRQYGLFLQRMLRLLNQITREEMVGNFVHLENFK
jgi:predicted nuclease of predicted toxin-antitoxin system